MTPITNKDKAGRGTPPNHDNRNCRVTHVDQGIVSDPVIMPLSNFWDQLAGMRTDSAEWPAGHRVVFEILPGNGA
jgi:hypothetical protein